MQSSKLIKEMYKVNEMLIRKLLEGWFAFVSLETEEQKLLMKDTSVLGCIDYISQGLCPVGVGDK